MSGDEASSQQLSSSVEGNAQLSLDANKQLEPSSASSAPPEENKAAFQQQQPVESGSSPSVPNDLIQKRENDDDEDENENQSSALKQALQEEKEVEEVEDLYSYKLDAEWFKTLDHGITLSQEKSQVTHFNDGHKDKNADHQAQQENLEPFAQQCMHLFSGEWTTLKPTDLYEKVLPEDNQYVCAIHCDILTFCFLLQHFDRIACWLLHHQTLNWQQSVHFSIHITLMRKSMLTSCEHCATLTLFT